MNDLRHKLLTWARAGWRAIVLTCAWVVFSILVVTWMAATVALVYGVDRSGQPDDAGAWPEFLRGWRRHWKVALPLGAISLVVLAALLANLLFLSGQQGAPAFLLLVGTVLLLALWAMGMLSLVPALVLLAHLPWRDSVRTGLLLAFRHPFWTLALVFAAVLIATALGQVWEPLAIFAVPVTGYLSLRLTQRHLDAIR